MEITNEVYGSTYDALKEMVETYYESMKKDYVPQMVVNGFIDELDKVGVQLISTNKYNSLVENQKISPKASSTDIKEEIVRLRNLLICSTEAPHTTDKITLETSSYREVKDEVVRLRKALTNAKTDKEKLIICQNNDLVRVVCDNDDTMICFVVDLELDHEEILITSLSEYVGYDEGVFNMFELLNIRAESV